jgi:hypothetical protein
LAIDRGPPAVEFSWSELTRVALVIQPRHQAVDPTEAQRFLDGSVIADGHFSRMMLVKDEPYLGF